ncbi:thioredoxin domain-containing protein [Methyloceanibacter sp.]|uniref:thioredoxin domain-containing protein n=1 Tax=Methyloceanibacter sp. TaxID=1965321 RepID=UPI003D6C8CE0
MTDAPLQERATQGNRLGRETSPYLLQHQHNPVHWRAWGPEALAEAKRTGKPILLSVGYAACHWCHVMAHESFEDEETARVMNDLFVNIKVDREERPDVDAIYMAALHELGEQGGWPLTMFLTSDAEPFWGGTYFPREARYGRPAFTNVLKEIARIYREEQVKVRQNADALKDRLAPKFDRGADAGPDAIPGDAALADLARRLLQLVDPTHGGIKGAPKFPQVQFFNFLWRAGLRYGLPDPLEAVTHTLTHIAQGGIYDHLGGGFARYSVDERWLVPHFEKMLYDNALLLELMTELWRETKSPLLAARVRETVDWLFREMVTEEGGFASSLDADSEGEEGKFYVWSAAEIEEVLGAEDARLFAEIYDVTPGGNFEGHTILNRINNLELSEAGTEARLTLMREKLLARRASRVRPGFDDKVLADWNGLMIAALAKAADAFDRPDWLAAAERAFNFVSVRMTSHGRLKHSYRAGEAKAPATATDYANMIKAALALASVTGKPDYVASARAWVDVLDRHYWAEGHGGYFLAADDTGDLIVRTINALDDATPNANGIMVSNLMALFSRTGEERYRDRAEAIVRGFSGAVSRNVFAHTGLLTGALDLLAPAHIVIVVPAGGDARELRRALANVSLPGAVVQEVGASVAGAGASHPPSAPAYGKTALHGKPTAYVCIGPQCSMPVTEPAALVATVKEARQVRVA